jgi:hypothetical protein
MGASPALARFQEMASVLQSPPALYGRAKIIVDGSYGKQLFRVLDAECT